ncbi:alpha/beta hydrolase family esterase [Tsukamurella soli]|uniref:PHB depolymerase family esterase n=1 Tax=Tsukamurella soli TaxID=644556 RepID=A0ABP8KHA7_9ACTN
MNRVSIDVASRRRTFFHLTPNVPRDTAPLLLALHGTTQNGRQMQRFSGGTLVALAERIGADLVCLNGYHRAWNDGRTTKYSAAQRRTVDDTAFVQAVVARFERPALAIGYSNGGQLVHRMLREIPGTFVGATIVAAGLPVDDDYEFAGVAPDSIPLLMFHGTGDPVVPYGGGATRMLGRTRGEVRSALDTAATYATGEPVVSSTGTIERRDWAGVRLVTQIGAGHVIPNRKTAPTPWLIGPSHHDLDTGEEIRAFFGL